MPDFENMTDEEIEAYIHDYLVEQDDSLYASRVRLHESVQKLKWKLRQHFEPYLVWLLNGLVWIIEAVGELGRLLTGWGGKHD